MKKLLMKMGPLYKKLLIFLTINIVSILISLLVPSGKIRVLCLTALALSYILAIPLILLPLRTLYLYFLSHHTLNDEFLPPDNTDFCLINDFLKTSYEKSHSIESALSDKNIDYLSKQINSHFFYNTLDSIRGRAFCDGAYFVADMIETLSSFFRYSISRKGNIVSVQDELQNLAAYMKIQMFRFGNRIQYEVALESDSIALYQIPKLTLQPIVENAIIHGIESYESDGMISINIFETDSTIVIHVKDNGVGIPKDKLDQINLNFQNNHFESPEVQKKHMNIALNNINNRICLLYGSRFHLHIFSTRNLGTDVQITLPKILKEKEMQ